MPYSNSTPAPTLNPAGSGLGYGAPPSSTAQGGGGGGGIGGGGMSGRRPLPRPPGASGSYAGPGPGPASSSSNAPGAIPARTADYGVGGGPGEDELPIYSGEGGYRDEKARVPSHGGVGYDGAAASGSGSSAQYGYGLGPAQAQAQAEDGRRSRVSSGMSMRPLPVLPPALQPQPQPQPQPQSPPYSAPLSDSAPSTATPVQAHGIVGTHAGTGTGTGTYGLSGYDFGLGTGIGMTDSPADSAYTSASTSRTGHETGETYPSAMTDTTTTATARTDPTIDSAGTQSAWTPATSISADTGAGGYGHGHGRGHEHGYGHGYAHGEAASTPTQEKMASPEEYSGLGARRDPIAFPDPQDRADAGSAIETGGYTGSEPPYSSSSTAEYRRAAATDGDRTVSSTSDLQSAQDGYSHSYNTDTRHSSSSHLNLNLDELKRPLSEIPQSAGSAFNAFPTARPHLPVPMAVGDTGSVRSFYTASELHGGGAGAGASTPLDRSGAAGPGASPYPNSTTAPGPSNQPPPTANPSHPTPNQPSNRESFSSQSPLSASWQNQTHQPASWVQAKLQIHQGGEQEEDELLEEEWDEQEVEEIHFFQPALLSEAAVQLRDRVERGRHLKGGIAWVGSFTGRDLVTTIQGFLPSYTRESPSDRRFALLMAQSLQNQLWFVEVDWDIKPLRDSAEDVFRFMGDAEGMGDAGELPKGLMTMATRCYSPSCSGDGCYAPRCPYRTSPNSFLQVTNRSAEAAERERQQERERRPPAGDWTDEMDPRQLRDLTPEMVNRQNIIRQAIQSEVQYEADLTGMYDYVAALRQAQVVPFYRVESFIVEVFGNAMDLREACRRMLEHFAIRQREQAPLIQTVGDIFLEAATDFRIVYPEYTGNVPIAEQAIKKEMEENPDFARFNERMVREHDRRRDVKYLIARPTNQLQRYPAVLEAIIGATPPDDPDMDFLREALASIESLSAISQLKVVHTTKGKGKKEWFDLVPKEVRDAMPKKEQKRQMIMWELIQGEMEYVTDLELLEDLFIAGLREADVPIIERSRLEIAIDDMFHNFRSLIDVHSLLLERLQSRQVEQHPQIGTISDLVFDAALNWQEAYMEYVTHYPIAKAKVQEESLKNPRFAAFLEACQKDPRSNRQDIYHFIYRPVPRLLRYNLLLENILEAQKAQDLAHPDVETIPQVMELIADLGRATQKGVAVNNAKVELWTFQHSLDGGKFGSRSVRDLDLLNPMRELIYKGRVFRQPDSIGSAWIELLLLLFDNYLVLAKPEKSRRAREGREVPSGQPVRYVINRRPIPLELLSLGSFNEAPRPRPTGRFTGVGSAANAPPTTGVGAGHDEDDTRSIWPLNILFIGQGQLGGQYTLFAESNAIRAEWKEKLLHARVLRAEVNDAGKVFEMTALSTDTFIQPPNYTIIKEGDSFTGQVTCSAPFVTPDGRSLVAIGCEEGVWIGLRGDAKSLRKVLHVKAVTSLAVLEEFGIFLVLQDRSLLAYHLEALVPTASSPSVRAAPQRLSPGKDIVFFTVGQLSGRTLVLYMKKKGMDSLFRVLEPIMNRGDAEREQRQQRRPFGNILGQRAEWFRLYKDFFIPTEALNVHFLKHKLAVVCAKGFEIMDLTDLKGGSIPIFDPAKLRDRPHLAELQRRCDSARPLGMFRSTETEFFLVYDSFGLYVDRHGEPNRAQEAIEWEGRPDSVAFHPPYVLLVSAQFIEIRHIDTAKLVQIYTGQDIRLTWDGTGGMARPFVDNPGPKGYGDEAASQDPRIHISQRAESAAPVAIRPKGGIVQTVFELTPTLLLNNPLLNPVHTHDSNYFPPAPMVHEGSASIRNGHSGHSGYGGSMSMSQHRQSRDTTYSYPYAHNGGVAPVQRTQTYQPGYPHAAHGQGYGYGHGQGANQGQGHGQGQGQGQSQGYTGSIHRPSSISTSTSEYYYASNGNGNGNSAGNGNSHGGGGGGGGGMQTSSSGVVPLSTNASMINAWQAAQQPFSHAYGQQVQQQQQQQYASPAQTYRSRESYDSVSVPGGYRPPVYPDSHADPRQYAYQQQQQQQQQQYQSPQGQGYGQQQYMNAGYGSGSRGNR